MPETLRLLTDRLDTPLGELTLVADDKGNLRSLDWADHRARMDRLQRQHYGTNVQLVDATDPHGLTTALRAYFAGELSAIEALPVAAAGTAFQKTVWAALREIPCGTTLSYGELAARLGNPKAVRAVGLANGRNPVGIVVPCHRVIGADGSLTGYGGGIERKRWLLRHEGALGELF